MQIAERNEIHTNTLYPRFKDNLESLASTWAQEAAACLGNALAEAETKLKLQISHDEAENIFSYVLALLNDESVTVPIELTEVVTMTVEFFARYYRFPLEGGCQTRSTNSACEKITNVSTAQAGPALEQQVTPQVRLGFIEINFLKIKKLVRLVKCGGAK